MMPGADTIWRGRRSRHPNSLTLVLAFLLALPKASFSQIKINTLVLYDESNMIAKNGMETAVRYLQKNPSEQVTVNNNYMHAIKSGVDIKATINTTCDLLDKGITDGEPPHVVIDLTKSTIVSETVKSLTRSLALPTFSASYGDETDLIEWQNLSKDEAKFLVQLAPPGDAIVTSIRDLVIKQNITNAAIIYDNTFVMEHKYKSLLRNVPCRHMIVQVKDNTNDMRAQIKKLKETGMDNYFAVGSLQTIRNILDAANANGMFGKTYVWYGITKETENVGCGCENATIVSLKPNLPTVTLSRINKLQGSYGLKTEPEIDAAFYFDFALRGILAAGKMMKDGKYDSFDFIKCSGFDKASLTIRKDFDFFSALKDVKLTDSVGPIMWKSNGLSYVEVPMSITKIQILDGETIDIMTIGEWSLGTPARIIYKSGLNLQDHKAITVYRITTVEQPPFIMKRMGEDNKPEFYGYCIDLINEITGIVDFEFEITEAPDKMFGTMNDEMEWTGMIKELVENRADIALAPLSVMAERENVVDFTVPYYDLVGITIMMLKPKVETSLFKFLTVLELEVWLCILVAYAFTSFLMWFFDRFSPYSYQNNKEKYKDDDEQREFTLKECLWFCMTSLTPQGGGEAPKNLSGRLVAATWWLFGFIIIASYTANLAAFLTVSRLDTPIESLDDLSNQYKVQYSPMNGTAPMTYFERMAYIEKKFYEIWKDMSLNDSMSDVERAKLAVWDYPVSDKYTKMWQSMQEAGLPKDFRSALKRIRSSKSSSEGYAYLGDATDIRYQVLTNCDLQIVGEEFSRKPYAIAVQQGSPLKDLFNDAILKLLNQRKLETLKERWWNQNPKKQKCIKEDDQSDGISIDNIGGVFIVIFVGIALACLTLAFEYWWYKHRKGSRVTDSAKITSVREFPNGSEKPNFGQQDKSNFNTEYKEGGGGGFDVAPVANPW